MELPDSITAPSGSIRVLFAVRRDLEERSGGDTVQILNTAKALGELGVEVTISSDDQVDLSRFDCVHLWHLERTHETYIHLLHARACGKPTVLSPIYWSPAACSSRSMAFPRARHWRAEVKNIVRLVFAGSARERHAVWAAVKHGWARCRQEILEFPMIILPNSRAEAELLAQEAPAGKRFRVVPNAIDLAACQRTPAQRPWDAREGVLCVGHFDPRKNQLALIEALRDTEVQVTFVGEARRLHELYHWRCRRAASARMRFLGKQEHDFVIRLMGRSRVHVCPSRFETPGLVNLEAAAMGCTVVVPDCPPVRDYFQDDAIYVDGDDPPSTRSAVLRALATPPSDELPKRIMAEYTWEAAARATLAGYEEAMRVQSRNSVSVRRSASSQASDDVR